LPGRHPTQERREHPAIGIEKGNDLSRIPGFECRQVLADGIAHGDPISPVSKKPDGKNPSNGPLLPIDPESERVAITGY
jgi:hypothetical protein